MYVNVVDLLEKKLNNYPLICVVVQNIKQVYWKSEFK